MKKILALVIFLLMVSVSFATTFPTPQGKLVNDYTATLDSATKERLEIMLRTFEQKTTNELAVVIVPDLQGENIDMYAVKLFEQWKIGKKGKDNGLLFLLAMKERKWRFEVGYGLEGVLNDAKVGSIGRDTMVPYFKNKDFGTGIEQGLSVVIKEIERGNVAPVKKAEDEPLSDKAIFLIILGIFCLSFIVGLILYYMKRKEEEKIVDEPVVWTTEHEDTIIPPLPPVYREQPVHRETKHEDEEERHSYRSHDDDSYSSSSSSFSSGSSFDFGGGSSGGAGASGDF